MLQVEKILRVRSELRELRKISHRIDKLFCKRNGLKGDVWLCEKAPKSHLTEQKLVRLKEQINSLDFVIERSISEATALEAKYMKAINKLEPLDRTIILDGYINGKAYRKIGKEIGYTERGVQKRIDIAIECIASLT